MKKKSFAAIIVMILLCGLQSNSFAQTTNVNLLEKRITELERRVTQLEQKHSNTQQSQRPTVPNSRNKALWRTLKLGMSQNEVRAILGEPLKIDVQGSLIWWYYSKESWHSSITFLDVVVHGWTEPE